MTQPSPVTYPPELVADVYRLLGLGSPRLAYARANGVSLVPYDVVVPAPFTSTSVTQVPDAGNKEKLQQDVVVVSSDFQITNIETPSGLDSLTNFFFAQDSGIVARMKIVGAGGGYNPAPDLQPVEFFRRTYRPEWLLTYNNGIKMDFQATVPLPFAVNVNVVLHTETTYWLAALQMTAAEAFRKLTELGFNVTGYNKSGV